MTVTDSDRELCRVQSQLIYENHLKHDPDFDSDGYHVSSEITYLETLRRGMLTECAFVNEFGGSVSRELNHHGDGGIDFLLDLKSDNGIRRYAVDVKTKSVRYSWEGLRRSGTHLRVLCRELRPATIYVFGIYLEPTDDAEVLAWQWGSTLRREGQLQRFKNSTSDENWNHVMLFEELRPLAELKARCVQ